MPVFPEKFVINDNVIILSENTKNKVTKRKVPKEKTSISLNLKKMKSIEAFEKLLSVIKFVKSSFTDTTVNNSPIALIVTRNNIKNKIPFILLLYIFQIDLK